MASSPKVLCRSQDLINVGNDDAVSSLEDISFSLLLSWPESLPTTNTG